MRRAPRLWIALAFIALDVAYLHWVWAQLPNWGIWDWDFQQSLLEVARLSLVEFGELPLWNPYLGGGTTLVGHPLARTFNPSFVPVLLFGTIPGIKISILLYLVLGQAGAYLLARETGLRPAPALLAAGVFSLASSFAQHLTHGHFEWLAYAWLPWIVWALYRAIETPSVPRLALGGSLLAASWLDGGPYHVSFQPLFLLALAAMLGVARRSLRPLGVLAGFGVIAAGLAAVQLVPVAETVISSPRLTGVENNFYEALRNADSRIGELDPNAWRIFYQGYLSRDQSHDAERWMPFVVNVGTYVGPLPLVLALVGATRLRRGAWVWVACGALFFWLHLGPAAPIDLWAPLHTLPGFSSLHLPVRFNVFVLLALALLAGRGLEYTLERSPARRWIGGVVVALVCADLFAVGAPIFRVAFSVPPIEVERRSDFAHYATSPYTDRYRRAALYPVWDNWPNATFPTIREHRGVIQSYLDFPYPRRAIPFDHERYPGGEAWFPRGEGQVQRVEVTPNRITLETTGTGGRVVVNQNHRAGWELENGAPGRVEARDGLLSLLVPAGDRTTTLRFRPRSFAVGAAISLASALLLAGSLGLVAIRRSGPRNG